MGEERRKVRVRICGHTLLTILKFDSPCECQGIAIDCEPSVMIHCPKPFLEEAATSVQSSGDTMLLEKSSMNFELLN